jgi:5'-methylthioadenosine phosphorylase
MGRLALVVGSHARDFAPPRGEWATLKRHGEGQRYALPHEIDHGRNMRGLVEAGCDRVLAIGSAGGLSPELGPGRFVCPDDFIALDAPPATALEGVAAHRVPGFDDGWRDEVLQAFTAAGTRVADGGVYWQATGPRLETRAEIRLVAQHADVIGMTVASECVAAGELGLRYAAVCLVDNFANGIADTELMLPELEAARAEHVGVLAAALETTLPTLS